MGFHYEILCIILFFSILFLSCPPHCYSSFLVSPCVPSSEVSILLLSFSPVPSESLHPFWWSQFSFYDTRTCTHNLESAHEIQQMESLYGCLKITLYMCAIFSLSFDLLMDTRLFFKSIVHSAVISLDGQVLCRVLT